MSAAGDRTLSVFMTEDKFYFSTYNSNSKNVYKTIDHNDLEGIWTFIYYSYSSNHKKVVGYVKIGGLPIRTILIDTVHRKANYLLFKFGGK
jgi:hypothetical protein